MSDLDLQVQCDVKGFLIPNQEKLPKPHRFVTGLDGRGHSAAKNSAKPCGPTFPTSAQGTFVWDSSRTEWIDK